MKKEDLHQLHSLDLVLGMLVEGGDPDVSFDAIVIPAVPCYRYAAACVRRDDKSIGQ